MPTSAARPTSLELRDKATLRIEWSDGVSSEYRAVQLRDACPCATCREKRSQPETTPGLLPVLSQAETQPLTIAAMKPVGNYAYGIEFSDGHNTGIYTIERLRELGKDSTTD